MILDGLTIMLLGLSTVFLFLLALTFLITLLSRVFSAHALAEEARIIGENAAKRQRKFKPIPATSLPVSQAKSDHTLTAVIGAAISAHRSRQP